MSIGGINMKKRCSFCKKEIDLFTKECPYCYEEQGIPKIIWIVLGILIILCLVIGIYLGVSG